MFGSYVQKVVGDTAEFLTFVIPGASKCAPLLLLRELARFPLLSLAQLSELRLAIAALGTMTGHKMDSIVLAANSIEAYLQQVRPARGPKRSPRCQGPSPCFCLLQAADGPLPSRESSLDDLSYELGE